MRCRFPIQLSVDLHGKKGQIFVPCGKCAWCKAQIRNEWFVRFVEESKHHNFTRFVTLDYRDEDLPINEETGEMVPSVSLSDIQKYHKRIRKKYSFRFFLASEYGSKFGRPHYHGIYWSDEKIPFLDLWPHGDCGADLPASPASFKYVTKYILKGSNVPDGASPLFHVMSRRPGIGIDFVDQVKDDVQVYNYFGQKMKLPSYYSRKFLASLPDDQQSVISDSKLEYLSFKPRHSELKAVYDDLGIQQPFEDWMSDLYRKDFIKQIQINHK